MPSAGWQRAVVPASEGCIATTTKSFAVAGHDHQCIEDIVTRADLVDRAVLLMLKPIADSKRRGGKEIDIDLEAKRPRFSGAIGWSGSWPAESAKIDMLE
jgi:hypothetical protein